MKLLRGFADPECYRDGYVSIGNFDGVHRGHQSMIAALVRRAREAGAPAVVLTFDPHPIRLLRPTEAPPSLSTLARKSELLERHGVDCTIVYPTDEALLELSPEAFFEQIVLGELSARGLVEGPNFFFGRNRAGNVESLRRMCAEAGITLDVAPPLVVDGDVVSSSLVRELVRTGHIGRAVALLGHPYRLQGTVSRGAGRGAGLGFPTANLEGVTSLPPGDGVYGGVAEVGGQLWAAAVNIGPNPTFNDARRKFEVHLLEFVGDLYGRRLDVDLYDRIRNVVRFETQAELQSQLERDLERVAALVGDRLSG